MPVETNLSRLAAKWERYTYELDAEMKRGVSIVLENQSVWFVEEPEAAQVEALLGPDAPSFVYEAIVEAMSRGLTREFCAWQPLQTPQGKFACFDRQSDTESGELSLHIVFRDAVAQTFRGNYTAADSASRPGARDARVAWLAGLLTSCLHAVEGRLLAEILAGALLGTPVTYAPGLPGLDECGSDIYRATQRSSGTQLVVSESTGVALSKHTKFTAISVIDALARHQCPVLGNYAGRRVVLCDLLPSDIGLLAHHGHTVLDTGAAFGPYRFEFSVDGDELTVAIRAAWRVMQPDYYAKFKRVCLPDAAGEVAS